MKFPHHNTQTQSFWQYRPMFSMPNSKKIPFYFVQILLFQQNRPQTEWTYMYFYIWKTKRYLSNVFLTCKYLLSRISVIKTQSVSLECSVKSQITITMRLQSGGTPRATCENRYQIMTPIGTLYFILNLAVIIFCKIGLNNYASNKPGSEPTKGFECSYIKSIGLLLMGSFSIGCIAQMILKNLSMTKVPYQPRSQS